MFLGKDCGQKRRRFSLYLVLLFQVAKGSELQFLDLFLFAVGSSLSMLLHFIFLSVVWCSLRRACLYFSVGLERGFYWSSVIRLYCLPKFSINLIYSYLRALDKSGILSGLSHSLLFVCLCYRNVLWIRSHSVSTSAVQNLS